MSNTTTTHHVTGADELQLHHEALTELFASVDLPATAQLDPLSTWWRHHHEATPWAVLISRQNRLVAAAMLVRTTHAGVYKFELPGESGVPNQSPALDAAAAESLADSLQARLAAIRRPWVLTMRGLEGDDPVAAAMLAHWPRLYRRHAYDSPRILFSSGAGLSRYLSRNTRSAVAKARNRIKGDGVDFAMDWHHEPAEIESVIPEMVELYRERSQQAQQSVGLLEDPDYRDYFTAMLRSYAHSNRAQLLTVRLNHDLASYALCLDNGGILFVYSNRMSPRWLRYSPGTIANAEVIRLAHDDCEVTAVDWGGGLQRYKLSGPAVLHPHFEVQASSSSLAARSVQGVRAASRWRRRARRAATAPRRLRQLRSA